MAGGFEVDRLLAAWLAPALALSCSLAGSATPVPTFRIHAPGVEDPVIETVRRDLSFAERRIGAKFGSFPDTVSVRIFPERASFSEALRERWGIPETACWMVGAAEDHALLLLSPGVWGEAACEHDPADSGHRRRLIAHEAVHVYHGQVNPSEDLGLLEDLGWFIEGLATYVSGQAAAEHAGRAAEAVLNDAVPARLREAWSGDYRYGVTGSMATFIEERWGREVFSSLLGVTSTEDLLQRLEIQEADFLEQWRRWVLDSAARASGQA